MSVTLRDMSVEQFRKLLRTELKESLRELLTDPDAGLALRPAFVRRLRRSLEHLDNGDETVAADEMARRLGFEW